VRGKAVVFREIANGIDRLHRDSSDSSGGKFMPGNKAVAYIEPGKVEVQTIDYPELTLKDGPGVNKLNIGRKCEHGVILKVVSTNICGSDQHMVRGRTTAPKDLVLGHEITGEVIETGRDVEFIKKGDLCSVPFNIACGRCRSGPARPTATSTWAVGSAGRPST
jgi:glutathione-independent formaldehyde dehydrogenase